MRRGACAGQSTWGVHAPVRACPQKPGGKAARGTGPSTHARTDHVARRYF